ncbi:hypothetical protein CNR22_06840 [Sphingobacteriaceae bacterium]|nr:hypothetical protein CNR22_06840 [Sphingobacteriaceae bacterium]
MDIRRKLILLCVVILSGNALIGYTAYKRNQKQNVAEAWVEHTEKIILISGELSDLAKEVKNAAKNFVVTLDSGYLKPMQKGKLACQDLLVELICLTADSKPQRSLLDSLTFYINANFHSSLQMIELRRKGSIPTAALFAGTPSGNYNSDMIQKLIHSVQLYERVLLKKRKQINEKSAISLDHINILMFILMTALIILLLILTAMHLIHNKEKEQRILELSLAHKKINFRTKEKKEKSAALFAANQELVIKNSEKEKLAEELILANDELIKIEADQKEYILELEKMMYMISHEVRQPVAHLMGLSNLFDEAAGSSTSGLKKIVGFMKQAVSSLDGFTRDLTKYVSDMMQKRKDEH